MIMLSDNSHLPQIHCTHHVMQQGLIVRGEGQTISWMVSLGKQGQWADLCVHSELLSASKVCIDFFFFSMHE